MANIDTIKVPNGTSYGLQDKYKSGVYFVMGTQTAATDAWTGALHGVSALFDGLTILYYLPHDANSGGNATLNLTLDDGTTTGAINCFASFNDRLTRYEADSIIRLTYTSPNWHISSYKCYKEDAIMDNVALGDVSSFTNSERFGTAQYALTEGQANKAKGYASHAEGTSTTANDTATHAEGASTTASGATAHSEGSNTTASAGASHSEGSQSTASGVAAHAEGSGTTASGTGSHSEGHTNTAEAQYAHAEGEGNIVSGPQSHVEGSGNTINSTASNAHAEGNNNTVNGANAHAEGLSNTVQAIAYHSHVEGAGNNVTGEAAHAEGINNTASGRGSHAEGGGCTATGDFAHAEGYGTLASGGNSHAGGGGTIASKWGQTAVGRYNLGTEPEQIAFLVGGGTGTETENRRTVFGVSTSGMTHSSIGFTFGAGITSSFPTERLNWDYNDVGVSTTVGIQAYLKAYLKKIVTSNAGLQGGVITNVNNSTPGYVHMYFHYAVADYNNTGLPRKMIGIFHGHSGDIWQFKTEEGVFYSRCLFTASSPSWTQS